MSFPGSDSEHWTLDAPEGSPRKLWTGRAVALITTGVALLSFVFCVVKAFHEPFFYLLAVNMILSGIVSTFITYWYRSGDLAIEKFWFMMLVAVAYLLQSIATDVYIFN
ncbi:Uncharacterised protein g6169 [Pycnogonum litorale]